MQAVLTAEAAAEAIATLMPALGKALLFMGHLHTLRFLRWDPESPDPALVTQASPSQLIVAHTPLQEPGIMRTSHHDNVCSTVPHCAH